MKKLVFVVVLATHLMSPSAEAGRGFRKSCRSVISLASLAATWSSNRLRFHTVQGLNLWLQHDIAQSQWLNPPAQQYLFRSHFEQVGVVTRDTISQFNREAVYLAPVRRSPLNRFALKLQELGLSTGYAYSAKNSGFAMASYSPFEDTIFFSEYEMLMGTALPYSEHELIHALMRRNLVLGRPTFLNGGVISNATIDDMASGERRNPIVGLEELWAHAVEMKAMADYLESDDLDDLRAFVLVTFGDTHRNLGIYVQRMLPVVRNLLLLGDKTEVELSDEPAFLHYRQLMGISEEHARLISDHPSIRHLYVRGEMHPGDFMRVIYPIVPEANLTPESLRLTANSNLRKTLRLLEALDKQLTKANFVALAVNEIDPKKQSTQEILERYQFFVVQACRSIYAAADEIVNE